MSPSHLACLKFFTFALPFIYTVKYTKQALIMSLNMMADWKLSQP